jgi:hypothetical protein
MLERGTGSKSVARESANLDLQEGRILERHLVAGNDAVQLSQYFRDA